MAALFTNKRLPYVPLVTAEFANFKQQLNFFKKRFPGKEFGFAAAKSSTANQVGMKVSNKVTETFEAFFKRLSALPSPSMVEKLPLLWKQENVIEKL